MESRLSFPSWIHFHASFIVSTFVSLWLQLDSFPCKFYCFYLRFTMAKRYSHKCFSQEAHQDLPLLVFVPVIILNVFFVNTFVMSDCLCKEIRHPKTAYRYPERKMATISPTHNTIDTRDTYPNIQDQSYYSLEVLLSAQPHFL